jgi:hypothetical protein
VHKALSKFSVGPRRTARRPGRTATLVLRLHSKVEPATCRRAHLSACGLIAITGSIDRSISWIAAFPVRHGDDSLTFVIAVVVVLACS